MSKAKRASGVLIVAIVLALLNILFFVTGVRWANEVMTEIASGSEDTSVLAAAERIETAQSTVDNALKTAAWVTVIGGALGLLAVLLRLHQRDRRQHEAQEIQSYQRNLKRSQVAKQRRRRRSRHRGAA